MFEDLNYHSSSKEKSVRGNYAPFMAKELRKAIMNKSKAKNSYVKCPSRENFVTYKNAKTKKPKRKFLKKQPKVGWCQKETFWKTVNPFLTNEDLIRKTVLVLEKMET